MAKVITITNEKGGIGKTTTALALINGLHKAGFRVLGIDLDKQANSTFSMGCSSAVKTVFSLLTQENSAREIIAHTEMGDFMPSDKKLAGADSIIVETGKEFRLREGLEPVQDDYDVIVIDTPPALNILTVNALTSSDYVVIPVKADGYSMQGLSEVNSTIQRIRKYCNPGLKVAGILLTCYKDRENLSKDMLSNYENVAKELSTTVFNTKIRESVAIREAQLLKQNMYDYALGSNAVQDYMEFVNELLAIIKRGM